MCALIVLYYYYYYYYEKYVDLKKFCEACGSSELMAKNLSLKKFSPVRKKRKKEEAVAPTLLARAT